MTELLDMDSARWVDTICEAALAISVRQFAQSSREKPVLRFLLREVESSFVRGSGFRCSPQSPAEIRPRRMRQVIVPQIAP